VGTVVEAIRLGAQDYLTKPFEKAELDVSHAEVPAKTAAASGNKSLREYCDTITEDICFLAASPQMVRIRQQILQIAPVDVPVFIYGESGVGKEVVARMIHMRSTRAARPSSRSIAPHSPANCSSPNCLDSNKALSRAPFVRNPENLNSPTRARSSSMKLRR